MSLAQVWPEYQDLLEMTQVILVCSRVCEPSSSHRGLKTLSGTNHDLVVCCWLTFNSQSNSQYIYIRRTIEPYHVTKCPCRSRASSKSIHRAHSKQFNVSSWRVQVHQSETKVRSGGLFSSSNFPEPWLAK